MAGRIVITLVVFQLLSMIPVFEIETIEEQILLMVKVIGWGGTHFAVIWIPALICLTNRKARKLLDRVAKRVLA